MKPVKNSRPQSVCSGIEVAASRTSCWDALTRPEMLAEWFADVVESRSVSGAAEFQFGDGDFFLTQISVPAELERLHWRWRFMGVGGTSKIGFRLAERAQGVYVEVTDDGEYTDGGADELREGWADFLGRLKNKLETGNRSRYLWSEVIGTGLVTHVDTDRLAEYLSDPEIWRNHFPDMRVEVRDRRMDFHRDTWSGRSTQADLTFIQRTDGAGVSIAHSGWIDLPPEIRFAERKYAADCWALALADIEAALSYEPCRASITAIPS